ncbi:hypothetical protein FRB93_002288 [Tulasnella sp. JGI-2019a]|nr:hypothetical protein FRB93_002288 [Tulasnella sp. JGI-2019a]
MSKKSTLDLLVRVRYSNPLPPPPYPPKLIDIPTDPKRYARVELTQNLSNETLLPMVVDAECGMPLDLCHFDSLWDGSTELSDLNPSTGPPIDPRDMFMLDGVAGASSSASGSQPNGVNVSWLRKTEYLSRDTAMTKQALGAADAARDAAEIPVDTSLPAQILAIEATFPPSDETTIDLKSLRHPTKPEITAVESYEFLPDPDLWANTYDVFRFAERPGERSLEVLDPRLDCGILRPQESDGEHFLSYYITKTDEEAAEYKERRRLTDRLPEDEEKTTAFQLTRDYETSKVEQDVANEFLLVLDDADPETKGLTSAHDYRGAYYSIIQRKITLRKKRAQKGDVPIQDKIDILQIAHQPFTAEDEADRLDALTVINDPAWIARAKEAAEAAETNEGVDAEGEIEDIEVAHHPPNGANGTQRHEADDDDDMDDD